MLRNLSLTRRMRQKLLIILKPKLNEQKPPTCEATNLICNEEPLNENMPQGKTNLSPRKRNARCVQARKRFTEGEQEAEKPCNCKEHMCDLELRICHMEQLLECVLGQLEAEKSCPAQLTPNSAVTVQSAVDTIVMGQPGTASLVPLHEAAKYGDSIALVRALVRGEDPNALDLSLHCAARSGETLCVELLLASGASLDTRDACGATPLAVAVCHGHQSIVKILLAEGAQVELPDKDGRTPLMCAVFLQNAPMVVLLMKHGASVNVEDRNGEGPLVTAARHCSMDILMLLISHSTPFTVQMMRAMNVAGSSAAFMILVKAAPMAATCLSKNCPLARVAKEGWLHPVRTILKNCVERQCRRDVHEKNIQHAIMVAGTEDVLRLLWKNAPVTMQWLTMSRASAMGWATVADPIFYDWKNSMKGKENNFPEIMDVLRKVTTEEAVMRLTKAHPHARLPFVARSPFGYETALRAAVLGWHKILKTLIKYGIRADSKWKGSSLLHTAIKRGNAECVKVLVCGGASVELRDEYGSTPLHCAAKAGHRNVVDVLLKKGADPTAIDPLALTPYQVATTEDIRNYLKCLQRYKTQRKKEFDVKKLLDCIEDQQKKKKKSAH